MAVFSAISAVVLPVLGVVSIFTRLGATIEACVQNKNIEHQHEHLENDHYYGHAYVG